MDDLISRQQAIDALGDYMIGKRCPEDGTLTARLIENEVINKLPPAQPEPCEDAVSRAEVLRMIDCINDHHAITPYKSVGAVTEHLTRIASSLPPVAPKQPDCAKCKSELANKIRGQQDNPGMLTENDKGRNWGLEWAAQIVEGKRR